MDRKCLRHVAILEQRNEGALLECVRNHEIRQSGDAEPGYRHVAQQVGTVAGEAA
jgi:hypothetical protein